jgi:glycosyltransferase involved in cell wall biosynthesis
MKILLALTYYRPHVSGLTIYVERLGRALAERGHLVTVLTSQYDRSLPREEHADGIRVVRVPVITRASKGVIMPTYGLVATRMVRSHDVLSIHLPQFDATGLALRGRLMHRPVVLTYHCDLQLPPGAFNRLVDRVVFVANLAAGLLADRIVAYTQDYADHSPLLSRFKRKLVVIPPPVVMPPPQAEDVAAFAGQHSLNGRGATTEGSPLRRGEGWGPVIGFAARFAAEKGVEYLLAALPDLLAKFPRLKVLFAGPYQNVLGEEAYYHRLAPVIEQYHDHWEFLGTLSPAEMPAFFANCDVLVVPSINSTESFGLVQVEAMLSGTPVVASNLPGVRQPVRMTGMGEVVPIADAATLAEGITKVLQNKESYLRPRAEIEALFDVRRTVEEYERLFGSLLKRKA